MDLKKHILEYFEQRRSSTPSITILTGIGGQEAFDESMEISLGFTRIYCGFKIPRILKGLRKTYKGRYYRLWEK